MILLIAAGALGQAWISYKARTTGASYSGLFYLTLCLIYTPSAALILLPKFSDNTKVWIVLYMSLTLLITRFFQYPSTFAYHDELVHQAIAMSINQTGHLFHSNSILPEASDYPGMEIVTTAIQHTTGLSLHSAGWVMLAIAHVIGTLAIIELMRRITGSMTVACVAVLIYTCNEESLFFNSQFSYASLALPLALFCIYVFTLRSKSATVIGVIPAVAVFVALAATHHLTSLAIVILLWGWSRLTQLAGRRVPQLTIFFAASTFVLLVWTWFARHYIVSYISETVIQSYQSVENLINGSSSHELFSTGAGYKSPRWEVYVSFGSILLIVIALIPALVYVTRRWRLLGTAGVVLTIMAFAYPLIPAGHLTVSTSEISDRSAPFLFSGLAFVIATWWFRGLTVQRMNLRYSDSRSQPQSPNSRHAMLKAWRPTPVIVAGLTVCFVGGGIIGAADWSYIPGNYMVGADNRSIDQLGLAAGYWEAASLRPSSRVVSDRDNGLVAQSIGGLHLVTPAADAVDEGSISNLLLRRWAPSDVDTACTDDIQYLISDIRLSTSLPEVGIYMDSGEYLDGTRVGPPPAGDLTKFDHVQGSERIYDNGAIRIYSLGGLSCPG